MSFWEIGYIVLFCILTGGVFFEVTSGNEKPQEKAKPQKKEDEKEKELF